MKHYEIGWNNPEFEDAVLWLRVVPDVKVELDKNHFEGQGLYLKEIELPSNAGGIDILITKGNEND